MKKVWLAVVLMGAGSMVWAQAPVATKPAASNDETAAQEHIDTTPPGLPTKVHPVEHKDLVYRTVNGRDLQLDVYEQPGGKAAPVIVYWHGGAWRRGERPKTYAAFRPLINMGFSVVSVDYRLAIGDKVPGDVTDPAPAQVEDVRCSLAWVGKHAAEYHFDLSRVVAYGTSAGGHLALLAGFLPAKNDVDVLACGAVPPVRAVMDFYGIPDVLTIVTSGVPLSKSTLVWLGGKRGTEPGTLALAKRMSPVTYLRKGLPPVFIAHGDADPTVPYTQSTELKEKLTELGVPVTLHTVAGGVHGKWTPQEMAAVWVDLLGFFRTNGVLK